MGTRLVDEQGCVRPRVTEANGRNERSKSLIPGTRSLFRVVQRLRETTNNVRPSWINKTKWLLAENGLRKMAMKKSVFNVELMDWPRLRNSKTKNTIDGSRFDNRTKSLTKINVKLLMKTTNNPTSFITSERSIRMELMAKNPFAIDDVGTIGFGNEMPGVVANKSLIFHKHRLVPIRVFKSDTITLW